MKVLIAPDSFKESMSARVAAESIRHGLLSAAPRLETILLPLADGGEGTVQSLVHATQGRFMKARVHDPLFREIEAMYGILGDGQTAVIEMAAASGIELLSAAEKNPLETSSFGTGELILRAMDQNCQKMIIGIGGSATNEGGAGIIQALGGQLLNTKGKPIRATGAGLHELATINLDTLDKRIPNVEFVVASDVDNILLGDHGATRVFGPQKGASQEMIGQLEKNLEKYGILLEKASGRAVIERPGAGAAGGLGAGMMAALGAALKGGFDIIAQITNLQDHIAQADLVITGGGKIDRQTMFATTPLGVARLAKELVTPVVVLAGQVAPGMEATFSNFFQMIRSITPTGMQLEEALMQGPTLLEKASHALWNELEKKGF